MGRPKGSKNKPKNVVVDTGEMILKQSQSKTVEEVIKEEKEKAKKNGLNEPDFDFNEEYKSGDKIYYVLLNYLTGDKELLELTVRTIYARSLVAWEDKGMARLIGYKDRDWIFRDRREAECYYKAAKVEAKYGNDKNW